MNKLLKKINPQLLKIKDLKDFQILLFKIFIIISIMVLVIKISN